MVSYWRRKSRSISRVDRVYYILQASCASSRFGWDNCYYALYLATAGCTAIYKGIYRYALHSPSAIPLKRQIPVASGQCLPSIPFPAAFFSTLYSQSSKTSTISSGNSSFACFSRDFDTERYSSGRPAIGERSVTFVPTISKCRRFVRPESGFRFLTCVSEIFRTCSCSRREAAKYSIRAYHKARSTPDSSCLGTASSP